MPSEYITFHPIGSALPTRVPTGFAAPTAPGEILIPAEFLRSPISAADRSEQARLKNLCQYCKTPRLTGFLTHCPSCGAPAP